MRDSFEEEDGAKSDGAHGGPKAPVSKR
jgi:hypothetical protein